MFQANSVGVHEQGPEKLIMNHTCTCLDQVQQSSQPKYGLFVVGWGA